MRQRHHQRSQHLTGKQRLSDFHRHRRRRRHRHLRRQRHRHRQPDSSLSRPQRSHPAKKEPRTVCKNLTHNIHTQDYSIYSPYPSPGPTLVPLPSRSSGAWRLPARRPPAGGCCPDALRCCSTRPSSLSARPAAAAAAAAAAPSVRRPGMMAPPPPPPPPVVAVVVAHRGWRCR